MVVWYQHYASVLILQELRKVKTNEPSTGGEEMSFQVTKPDNALTKPVFARISLNSHAELKRVAHENCVTMKELVRQMVEYCLKEKQS